MKEFDANERFGSHRGFRTRVQNSVSHKMRKGTEFERKGIFHSTPPSFPLAALIPTSSWGPLPAPPSSGAGDDPPRLANGLLDGGARPPGVVDGDFAGAAGELPEPRVGEAISLRRLKISRFLIGLASCKFSITQLLTCSSESVD